MASPSVEDAFEDAFEGVDPAALAELEAAAVKAAAVNEDAYIANNPRAQERAREAQALVEASLESDKNGTRVKRRRRPPQLFAEEEEAATARARARRQRCMAAACFFS